MSSRKLEILALELVSKNLKRAQQISYRISHHDTPTDKLLKDNPCEFRDTFLKPLSDELFELDSTSWIEAVIESIEEPT